MSKILVVGGVHADGDQGDVRIRFATALGRQIVLGGHTLLGACRTTLDAYVANSAAEAAKVMGQDPTKLIKSWLSERTKPAHPHGSLMRSEVRDWAQIPRGLAFPEPIEEADAIIMVGGWEGTHYAASWSRLAGKPLLPVAGFGGAAADIYRDEIGMFERRRYGTRIPLEDYHLLNRILVDESDAVMEAYAAEVLKLAEKTILSSDVFVVMPFEEKGHLKDAYNTFQRVCTRKRLTAMRVDHHLNTKCRIVPAIFSKIRHSAFVIAELSGARPNVFYELGFARALGKAVIHTAYKGTELPFDVYDVPTHYWDSQSELEEKLDAAIDELKGSLFSMPAAEWHT